MLRKIIKLIGILAAAILLLVVATIGRIDRSPLNERSFYQEMKSRLDTTKLVAKPGKDSVKLGWGRVNITPRHNMPMAGYILRDHFDSVHDSLQARFIVIDNGTSRAVLLSVDLLIFPPVLRDKLNAELKEYMANIDFLYLSATHTHNGVGGWDDSPGGRLILGTYDEQWVDSTANAIAGAIVETDLIKGTLGYWEADATDWIENRLAPDSGKVDGIIRGIALERNDGTKARLITYSAHATSIAKEMKELSADYPAKMIEILESNGTFGMFMAGMVGSHRFRFTPENNYEFIDMISKDLTARIENAQPDSLRSTVDILEAHVPIEFGKSQLRIDRNWKVNDWAFRIIFRKLQGELTVLELGNVMMVGTPCDFSGEIFTVDQLGEYARSKGKHLIITSFNGDYNGYITQDHHYNTRTKEEVMTLNWVGPYYGSYFSGMIRTLIDK